MASGRGRQIASQYIQSTISESSKKIDVSERYALLALSQACDGERESRPRSSLDQIDVVHVELKYVRSHDRVYIMMNTLD